MDKADNTKAGRISRRSFINTAACTSFFISISRNSVFSSDVLLQDWPSEAGKLRFYMIGHAHIDPVWLWPWSEGLAVVHSTFRSALDRLNETPGAAFISSSAQFYEWVSENDPGMINEIRKRIEEGRWNIVGGWWVEPDVNIPCGESLVRQGLYGQKTFQKLFERKATVAFNPDSFGHTATLPQIIKKQGMENYIFMRPAPHEKNLPSDLFWWEGPDGSKVLTYRIQVSYNDEGSVKARIENIISKSASQPMKSFMAFYGVGDHGGGATKENISSILDLQKDKKAPEIFFSTPEKYFAEMRDQKDLKIPVVKDDLQHHAPGCYTAESAIKKGNRTAESALIVAEKIAATGTVAWDFEYPSDELTEAWKRVLFLQFHDSLAGSSLFDHSETARNGFGHALDVAEQTTYKSLQKLEWQIPATDPASQYILVFNPHAWQVSACIEYDLSWNLKAAGSVVTDESGKILNHQWVHASTETGDRKKLLVQALLPPMGYKQIKVSEGSISVKQNNLNFSENSIENEYFRLSFETGGNVMIFDKRENTDIFTQISGGFQALIIDDPSDTWSHDIKSFNKVIGKFSDSAVSLLEKGPLRVKMRSVSKYNESVLTIDWSLCSGVKNIEAKVQLDWHEHLRMLKFSFPADIESPSAIYETAYGTIERQVNGDEDPGQRWVDISGKRKGKVQGLAVINDAKYGYSVHGNDLRISVARSAVYAHHNPRVLDMADSHLWMDQGIQTFRMLVVPHSGKWNEINIPRIAEEFIAPAPAIYQGIHEGVLAASGSFLSVSADNVIVSAVKKSESGNNIVVRCVETLGKDSTAILDLKFAGATYECRFSPYEIKTLLVDRKTRKVSELNLLEEIV